MVHEPKKIAVGFPYERQASNGEEMPDGIDYPDQVAYLCFRMLYAQLRMGVIDRETAVREKRKLLQEYAQYTFLDSLSKEQWTRIKRTDIARAEYRKCRTLENADNLLFALDGGNYGKQIP